LNHGSKKEGMVASGKSRAWTEGDLRRVDRLIAEGEARFVARQPESARLLTAARSSLAGGVTSSWQIAWPQPIWVSHGKGSKIFDADGAEYVDLHGGYGVNVVGHAHPVVAEAIASRATRGTHFAQPTDDAIAVAEELKRRFHLPLWRFGNSGTEATMDAVHLMRAATGRNLIVKIEGCYHGHHDSLMVSVANEAEELGTPHAPNNPAAGTGIPRAITELTLIAPYNDLAAMARIFENKGSDIAGVILEPIMMNAGIIPPEEGFLAGVRDLAHEHGALFAFDEVKTGVTIAYGGATEVLELTPDIICLAKAIGGGVPCGAIGGTEEVMSIITDGTYDQVGTFNGNPLTMASAKATLGEVLDGAAYDHLGRLSKQMVDGASSIIERYELPAYPIGFGAKGSVTFAPERVRNYRDFLAIDERISHAHWLFQHNGGVFLPPWGKAEQWMLSVQHTEDDAALFLDNLESFARALRG
jgi:glutamate-1-semialdehyde 2,1-aminomutase